jgi:pimeloyl-ACP methyl ester carboxylesterase
MTAYSSPIFLAEGRVFLSSMRRRTIYDGDSPHPHPYEVESGRQIAWPESEFLSFQGIDIHFMHRRHADTSKPTIVMLHGFNGSVFNFCICPLWEELALSHSLLAFDRPGWGLSERVTRMRRGLLPRGGWPTESGANPYTYLFSAQLLEHVLRTRGLWDAPKVLMAHSHGGLTAVSLLCEHEQLRAQFAGVVLVDAAIRAWPVPPAAARLAQRFPGCVRWLLQHLAWLYRAGSGVMKLAGVPFHDLPGYLRREPNGMRGWDSTFRVEKWKARKAFEEREREICLTAVFSLQEAFAEWAVANAAAPPCDLTQLRALPVLDVRGVRDKVIDPYDGVDTQALTGAETAFVSEAGHLPFCEQPEDFAFVVGEFLETNPLLLQLLQQQRVASARDGGEL